MTDFDCLQLFVNTQDEQAFATMVHRHKPMVYRVCLSRLGNHDDALDAMQLVFTKLYIGADTIQYNLSAWLRRCASNTAISVLRSEVARRNREMQWEQSTIKLDDPLEIEETAGIVRESLSRLTVRDRELIERYVIHNQSQSAIAVEWGVSQQAIAKRLSRIKSLLRNELSRRGIVSLGAVFAAMLPGRIAKAGILKIVASLEAAKCTKTLATAAVLVAASTVPVSHRQPPVQTPPPPPQIAQAPTHTSNSAYGPKAGVPVVSAPTITAKPRRVKPYPAQWVYERVTPVQHRQIDAKPYTDMYTVPTPTPTLTRRIAPDPSKARPPVQIASYQSGTGLQTAGMPSQIVEDQPTRSSNTTSDTEHTPDFQVARFNGTHSTHLITGLARPDSLIAWLGGRNRQTQSVTFAGMNLTDLDQIPQVSGVLRINWDGLDHQAGQGWTPSIAWHRSTTYAVTTGSRTVPVNLFDMAMVPGDSLPEVLEFEGSRLVVEPAPRTTWLVSPTDMSGSLPFTKIINHEAGMPEENIRRKSAWIGGAVALLTAGHASAGTIVDGGNLTEYESLAHQSEYDSVGLMSWGGGLASGVYLGDGWVLTAAHVAESSPDLNFELGGNSYQSEEIYLHDGWSGDAATGNDIALVKLTQDVVGVEAARLYDGPVTEDLSDTLIGAEATFVGYGRTGDGVNGAYINAGNKHAGQNVIDAFGGDHPLLRDFSDHIFFADFDDPNAVSDGYSWSDDLTLALEYMIAPGDSGGGVFIEEDGETFLVGVNSFLLAHDSVTDSDYGDVAGLTHVPAFTDWISAITGLGLSTDSLNPIVPEPGTLVLLAGLGWLPFRRPRR